MADCVTKDFVVIIAVDRSTNSEQAFDYYIRYLHKANNKVHVIHVPEGPTTVTAVHKHSHIGIEEWQRLMEKEAKETDEISTKFQEKLDELNISGVYKTFYGKPGEALCTAVLELEARLVVIGTRGLGSVRRTILGSVSDYLVRHSPVPVVICRDFI